MGISARVPLEPLAETRRTPPAWARGAQPASAFWYFANRFGEPWVARKAGDELLVTSTELGWSELRLQAAQAEAYLAELQTVSQTGQTVLAGCRLALDEALWLAAVISAAFLPLSRLRDGSLPPC